ncbi:ATP-binding protein [Candidatus Sumerlaeota bacterium]|nr:ATP-binding protein [Candidatus Sumerlaeota bacterium]
MSTEHQPLLAIGPDEGFVGRRQEIDQIYRFGLEAAGARRHSTLVVGRRGIGKSEILRRAYNRLFWNQSRVVPLCLTLTRETREVVPFARQWLATFLRQFIGFQRRDAALVNDEAMPSRRALRLAHEFNHPWLAQLVENFEESLRDEDWVSLLRNSVAAPLLASRNMALPVFTIVDEFQRIGRLNLAGIPLTLEGQFEFILRSHEAPHVLAGSSLRAIERLLGPGLIGRHIERMRIDPLPERPALRLWEGRCRRLDVDFDSHLGVEVIEQLERVPLYIEALVRAAAQHGVGLTSLRNVQMVYAHDLLHGEIGAFWGALFEEALPDVSDRRPGLEILSRLTVDPELNPVPWRHLVGITGLDPDRQQHIAEQLEQSGFLEIGHSQVYPTADRVMRDWVRLIHGREVRSETPSALRQGLVRDRLMWTSHLRHERAQRQLGMKVEALLAQWDCQLIPPELFDAPSFRSEHEGQLFQVICEAVEAKPATLMLPQVVGVSAVTDAPPTALTLMAFGFEEGRYAAGNECVTVVQIHRGGESVTATAAEEFLALVDRHTGPTGLENIRRWVIARGGFTEEAAEVLAAAECWTSDFTQLQILLRQFGIRTEQAVEQAGAMSFHGGLVSGEYALTIPMEADTELVAASAIDQIAAQAGFAEAARGQIKMAVIEACINAREHARQGGSIGLLIRPSDTHLEIMVENPGQVFDAEGVAQPVIEEKMGGGKGLRDKRGWGLKLMRSLMDEVIFEPCDDGTRVRLIKHRTPSAQTPPAPVIDVTES